MGNSDILVPGQGVLRAFGSAHTYRRYETSRPFVPNPAGRSQLHSQLLQDGQKSSSSWQLQLQYKAQEYRKSSFKALKFTQSQVTDQTHKRKSIHAWLIRAHPTNTSKHCESL